MSYNLAMSSKLVHSKKKKKMNNTKFLILAQCYLVTMLYTCGMELVSPIKKVGIQDNFEEREWQVSPIKKLIYKVTFKRKNDNWQVILHISTLLSDLRPQRYP